MVEAYMSLPEDLTELDDELFEDLHEKKFRLFDETKVFADHILQEAKSLASQYREKAQQHLETVNIERAKFLTKFSLNEMTDGKMAPSRSLSVKTKHNLDRLTVGETKDFTEGLSKVE